MNLSLFCLHLGHFQSSGRTSDCWQSMFYKIRFCKLYYTWNHILFRYRILIRVHYYWFHRRVTLFISRQTGIRAFFRRNKSPGRQKSKYFFIGTKKAGAGDRIVFLLRLTFSFSDFVDCRCTQWKALALHTSRQEHWDVIGCLRLFYQFSYRSCRSRPRIICISSSLNSKSKIS